MERGYSIIVQARQLVHSRYRHKYTNKKDIAASKKRVAGESAFSSPSLRQEKPSFKYATHCHYCTVKAYDVDGFPFEYLDGVSTWNCQDAILRSCVERGEEWADVV